MIRLYRKTRNLRASPFTVAAVIAYLESRRECDGLPGCKTLSPSVANKLGAEFYRKMFTSSFIAGTRDYVGGYENGALFHMMTTAFYHLEYEAGLDSSKPVDIEKNYRIPLFNDADSSEPFQDKYFSRRIDIVVQGQGEGKEVWVETKSYKSPFDPQRYKRWNFTIGKQSNEDLEDGESRAIHRQFFLDRVATQTKTEQRLLGGDMKWWFHGFKRRTVEGYKRIDLDKAQTELFKVPVGNDSVVAGSLGVDSVKNISARGLRSKVEVLTVKTKILDAFRSELFAEIEDVDYHALVTNSTHDSL